MALDFPASPSVNQTYSGPGGVVWVWDGAKWVSGTGSTVYAPVTSPVFLGNPTAPNPPAGDADTSVATTSFVAAAVGTALHDTGRNLLHNPLFNVAQRAAGPWTVTGYTLDRWLQYINTDTISTIKGVIGDGGRAAIGDEAAASCISVTFTGNAGAASETTVTQYIEDVRRLANKTVTVSFWAIAGVAGLKLGTNLAQNFGVGGSPSARVMLSGQAVTLAATWARYSLTFTLPSIAGKTLGTGADNTGLNFWFSCGATDAASAGNVGVQSGVITIWGVQLEIGSVATPLEKPDPRYDLANCQRFFWVGQLYLAFPQGTAGATVAATMGFATTMRSAPTIVITTNGSTNLGSVGTGAVPGGIYATGTVTATGSGTLNVNFTASADL